MKTTEVFLDKDYTIRHRSALEVLGKWFRIAEKVYWIPNKNLKIDE